MAAYWNAERDKINPETDWNEYARASDIWFEHEWKMGEVARKLAKSNRELERV